MDVRDGVIVMKLLNDQEDMKTMIRFIRQVLLNDLLLAYRKQYFCYVFISVQNYTCFSLALVR